jgi:nitric oxide dioxygenase
MDVHLDLGDGKVKDYICGPKKFMTEIHAVLRGRGVDPTRINMELFGTGDIFQYRH